MSAAANVSLPSHNLVSMPTTLSPPTMMRYKTTPNPGWKLPIFTEKIPSRSEIPFPTISTTGKLFFRDATKIMPLLMSGRDYVVYYITSHGTLLPDTFSPPTLGTDLPYSIIQTGGRESVGCGFSFGGNKLMMNLFSTNIVYSFQYLLGFQNDNLPQVYRDLHYSTNDHFTTASTSTTTHPELIPNKNLSFSKSQALKFGYGVYMYDPNRVTFGGLSNMFVKLDALDPYFMEGTDVEPSMFSSGEPVSKGITLKNLLPLIVQTSGLKTRPSIFVFYSCSYIDTNATPDESERVKYIVEHMGSESFYQLNNTIGSPALIEAIDSVFLPEIAKSPSSVIPTNWRKTNVGYRVNSYYNESKKITNTLFTTESSKEDLTERPNPFLPITTGGNTRGVSLSKEKPFTINTRVETKIKGKPAFKTLSGRKAVTINNVKEILENKTGGHRKTKKKSRRSSRRK